MWETELFEEGVIYAFLVVLAVVGAMAWLLWSFIIRLGRKEKDHL